MLDLTRTTNCIKVMKKYGTYDKHKIGVMKRDVSTITAAVSGFPERLNGELVLYREEKWPNDSMMQMGEYREIKQKNLGTVTVEIPLSREEIKKQKEKGSLLTTVGTIVGVPRTYVTEIRI
jgi:hypothetical protein